MQETAHRSFGAPDETRQFPRGRAEILRIGDSDIGRLVLEPGWRWSNDVKPIAGTASCEASHFQYHVSGQLAIRMDDGTEFIAGPGDVTSLPQGHDAWSWVMSRSRSLTGTAPATTRHPRRRRTDRPTPANTRLGPPGGGCWLAWSDGGRAQSRAVLR